MGCSLEYGGSRGAADGLHVGNEAYHHFFEYSILYFSIRIFVLETLFEYIRVFEKSFQHWWCVLDVRSGTELNVLKLH